MAPRRARPLLEPYSYFFGRITFDPNGELLTLTGTICIGFVPVVLERSVFQMLYAQKNRNRTNLRKVAPHSDKPLTDQVSLHPGPIQRLI